VGAAQLVLGEAEGAGEAQARRIVRRVEEDVAVVEAVAIVEDEEGVVGAGVVMVAVVAAARLRGLVRASLDRFNEELRARS
jgi:hypothetical protein